MEFLYTEYHYYIQLSFFGFAFVIVLSILLIELHTFYDYYKRKRTITIEENVKQSQTVGSQAPQTTNASSHTSATISTKSIDHKGAMSNSTKPKFASKRFVSYLLPILSYSFYLFMNLFSLIIKLNVNICPFVAPISTVSYFFAKMWMYFVFVYKLHIVYSKSLFQYRKKYLYSFAIFIIIYTMIIISFSIATVELSVIHFGENIKVCEPQIMFGVLESTVLFDLMIQSGCCYLFVRPLLVLNKMNKESVETGDQKKLFNVILKYTICTFVAVSSTFIILIIIAISKLVTLVAFDVIINCICIMLLNKKYDFYFKIVCCGYRKMCSILFGANKYVKQSPQTEDVDIHIESQY